MFIRVLPNQITRKTDPTVPVFWEVIKYAITQVDEVDKKYLQTYLTKTLHKLLNSRMICFVKLDEKRNLDLVVLAEIFINDLSQEKNLSIECAYAFKKSSLTEWTEIINELKKFGRSADCTEMELVTSNAKVREIVEQNGLIETKRAFKKVL